MFPRAQLNILYLRLTSFTVYRLVLSRSEAVSPNNEAKNTKGQVWSTAKQLLCKQNNDVIAAHVRPPRPYSTSRAIVPYQSEMDQSDWTKLYRLLTVCEDVGGKH